MSDPSGNGQPAPGLPPVVPPSGRFIAQLFLVPGLIVAAAVVVLLGFSWLSGGNRSPEAFLRDLESSNIDIRKRTASDLAQVLKRDDALATNVDFGLKLAANSARRSPTWSDRSRSRAARTSRPRCGRRTKTAAGTCSS